MRSSNNKEISVFNCAWVWRTIVNCFNISFVLYLITYNLLKLCFTYKNFLTVANKSDQQITIKAHYTNQVQLDSSLRIGVTFYSWVGGLSLVKTNPLLLYSKHNISLLWYLLYIVCMQQCYISENLLCMGGVGNSHFSY